MLRYLYRLALPGGRRVIIVYLPPKAVKLDEAVPLKRPEPPSYDRFFASAGLYSGTFGATKGARGKRTR